MRVSNVIASTLLSCALLAYSAPHMKRHDGSQNRPSMLPGEEDPNIFDQIAPMPVPVPAQLPQVNVDDVDGPPAPNNSPANSEVGEGEDYLHDLPDALEEGPQHDDLLTAEQSESEHEDDDDDDEQHNFDETQYEDDPNNNNDDEDNDKKEDHNDHPEEPSEGRVDDLMAERADDGYHHTTTTTHHPTHDDSVGDEVEEAAHKLERDPHPK